MWAGMVLIHTYCVEQVDSNGRDRCHLGWSIDEGTGNFSRPRYGVRFGVYLQVEWITKTILQLCALLGIKSRPFAYLTSVPANVLTVLFRVALVHYGR